MYKVFDNKIFRFLMCAILIVVFAIVPIENRMITAHAAVQAAVLIPVICAVLVAMGITFGGTYLNNTELQDANLNWRDNVSQSLLDLAQDIYDNCDGIIEALALSFPGGLVAITGAKHIVQIAPLVYQLIKKYLIQNYGEAAELEDTINGGTYFHFGVIKCGGNLLTPSSAFDMDNICSFGCTDNVWCKKAYRQGKESEIILRHSLRSAFLNRFLQFYSSIVIVQKRCIIYNFLIMKI